MSGLLLALAQPVSAQVVPPVPPDEAEQAAEEEELEGPPVSPRGAFFRSLVLPGWGQAYAGAPGKGAVYFALAGGSVWMSYVSRRQLADARREQFWLRERGDLGPTERTGIVESREQQFEDWAALTVFLFFLSGADAFVSAYFSDFDERIGIQPATDGSLRLEATLPVSRPR